MQVRGNVLSLHDCDRHEVLLVSMDITDAAASLPKNPRKGYEHAFRLDLPVLPTEGWEDTKYVVAVSSELILQQYVLPSASRFSMLSEAHTTTALKSLCGLWRVSECMPVCVSAKRAVREWRLR